MIFRFFSLQKGTKDAIHCTTLMDHTAAVNRVFSKVVGIRCDGTFSVYSVSTSGLLYHWRHVEEKEPEITVVENSGLSALDVYRENGISSFILCLSSKFALQQAFKQFEKSYSH